MYVDIHPSHMAAAHSSSQENTRVRYAIQKIIPLNYCEEGKCLADLLRRSDWGKA